MRILLYLIIGLYQITNTGCSVSESGTSQINSEAFPGYEITIRIVDHGNTFDKVMDVFSKSGLSVVHIHHIVYGAERQEIKITVKNGDNKLVNEIEYQLRSVLNVESVLIRKI